MVAALMRGNPDGANSRRAEMRSGAMRAVFSAVAVAVMVAGAAGCRSKGGPAGAGGEDVLDPLNPLDGGYSLAPRGEFGTPITDVQFENVAFSYDSFKIADSERRKIEEVANYMLRSPDVTVVVDGHCDERGSREYNLSLGEHRALAVRAYLISLGVAGDRIHTRSFGQEQPLDPEHNEAAWSKNRRGAFSLFNK
jgi:peptidoglycan-associated lipoprotein